MPRRIEDIDKSRTLGYGAELDASHPGFDDEDFKRRRVAIAHLSDTYLDGDDIPRVEYTEAERATWARVLHEMTRLHPRGACRAYLENFPKCEFTESDVPQLADVNKRLEEATGWRIRPAAGLLHPRAFLNGLAFGVFHSTQYVRHHSDPTYTPEPDLCHEMLGHIPMLMDLAFADTVRAIGEASLGAPDEDVWHLVKVYWYTVEFGVVREEVGGSNPGGGGGGEYRAFGAGILSSVAEMENLIAAGAAGGGSAATFAPLDPYAAQPKMSYSEGCQKKYFVLDPFRDDVREYSTHVKELHRTGRGYVETLRAREG